MLADGSLMVVLADGPALTALRYDESGTLLSTATFYPPVTTLKKVALDGFGAVAVTGVVAANNGDSWVMRYDGLTGKATWPAPATYNRYGLSFDEPVDAAFDSAGNVVVSGWSQESSGSCSLVTHSYSGATGAVRWGPKVTDIGSRGQAVSMTLDRWDNVVVVGKLGSPTYDWVTVKYLAGGGSFWGPRYYAGSGNGDDVPVAVSTDASGNVIVTGSTLLVSGGIGGVTSAFATIKYDVQSGSVLWGPATVPQSATPKAHFVDAQGNVFVTGVSYAQGNPDFVTLKYSNGTGAVLWGPVYLAGAAHGPDSPIAIAGDAAGRVHVTGTLRGTGGDDIATVSYDSSTGALLAGPLVFEGPAGGADAPAALVVDPLGNLIVSGTSFSVPTGNELVTFKYTGSGELVWGPVEYRGVATVFDKPVAIAADASQNLILLLRTKNDTDNDFALLKVSGSSGAILWGPVIWDSGREDEPVGLVLDGSGNAVVTGSSRNAAGNTDYATLKLSGTTGSVLWGPVLMDGGNADTPAALGLDAAGNVIVTGTGYGGSIRRNDFVTVKYDGSTGTVLWGPNALDLAGGNDVAAALAVNPLGDVIVGGHGYFGSDQEMVVVKYSGLTGLPVWGPVRLSGGVSGSDRVVAVSHDSAGAVFVSGYRLASSATDFVTFKLSSSGAVVWGPVIYSYGSSDEPVAVAVHASGDLIVVGKTLHSGQGYDLTALRYSSANGALVWGPVHVNGPWSGDDQPTSLLLDAAGDALVVGSTYDPARRTTDSSLVKLAGSTGGVLWGPVVHDEGLDEKTIAVARLGDDVVVALASYWGLESDPTSTHLVRYTEGLGLVTLPNDLLVAGCGTPYSQSLETANAVGPTFFTIVSGSLPSGLILTSAGVVTGTPLAVGSFSFRARVEDGVSGVERDYQLEVFEGTGGLAVAATRNPVCLGATTTLSVPGSYSSYAWYPGGAATATLTVSPFHATTYGVVVVDGTGCTRRGTVVVTPVAGALAAPSVSVSGPTRFCAGGSVILTSSLASAYLWSSGATTRAITVSGSGSYSVTVFDATGCSATSSATVVTVDPVPSAAIAAPASACAGSSGHAASVPDAGPGATYSWSITNGTITAGAGTPAVAFTVGSSGSVTLGITVVSGAGCSATSSHMVTLDPLPSADFSVPPAICAGSAQSATVVDAGPGASYSWIVTNGSIVSGATARQLNYVAGSSGTCSVNVTVQSGAGCVASKSMSSTISASPSAVISAGSTVCSGASGVTASVPDAGAGAIYTWSVGNGIVVSGASRTLVYDAGTSGSVDLSVTVQTSGGCSATGSSSVAILPPPSATITAPSSVCLSSAGLAASVPDAGTGATYSWSIVGGTITAGAGTPAVTFSSGPSGPVVLSATVVSGSGCAASSSLSVPVKAMPSATITAPVSVCAGTGVTASVPDAGQGSVYMWTVTNGTITSGGGPGHNSVTFTTGTESASSISVQVTNATGCTASGSASVIVDPNPNAAITAPSTACAGAAGLSASVPDAGAGAAYTWSITNGSITTGAGTRSVTFTAGSSGSVSLGVTVVTSSLCSASESRNVAVNPVPSATILAPAAACVGASGLGATVGDAGAGANYSWTIAGGTITAGLGTNSITFSAGLSGAVSLGVTVQTAAGCLASGAQSVPITPLPSAAISAPASVCAGATGIPAAVGDAGVGATYTWTITNGSITSGAGTSSVTFTAGPSGSVTLGVSVQTSTGCLSTGTHDVVVNPLPSAAIAAAASVCTGSTGNGASVADAGAGATYTWTITNGTITSGAGTRTIVFTAGASGAVALGVTVQTAAGCIATGSQAVPIGAPAVATITAPSSVCASSAANAASVADAGAGATYTWSITNGTITAGAGTRSISFSAGSSGSVVLGVTIQTPAGCTSTSSKTITLNSLPSATITAPTSVKKGKSASASVPTAGSGATYTWTIANGTITSGAGTRSITFRAPSSPGTLTLNVIVTKSNGCNASGTRNVTVTN